jgi:Tol biopolymer transport system component
LTGEPVVVADPVGSDTIVGGGFSLSTDGLLAYRSGAGALSQLRWYDRSGKALGAAAEPDSNNLLSPELSPDGLSVAASRVVEKNNPDVWLLDLVRKGWTRFTSDPAVDVGSIWSPNGNQIAFSSNRNGPLSLYLKPANSVHSEEPLVEQTANGKFPQDWSKDGRFLLYSETDPKTGFDLWALPMSGASANPSGRSGQKMTGTDREPIVIANTKFEEVSGQFSPDVRWVAYQTTESGQFQIVVQAFPIPTGKKQVSINGGSQPRWRADGKELYFIAPDGKMMAASFTSSGTSFATDTPVPLFAASLATGSGTYKQQYVVSRDGRFLLNEQREQSTNNVITLILNWRPKDSK